MADLSRSQKRQIVEALQTDYSVRQICEVLGFHRSSLYYQPKHDPLEQQLRDEIEKLAARYPTYGYRRITQMLLRMGYVVGYRRVARLMKADNLLVAVKGACQTTQSVDGLGQWVNRVENLDICRRNQVWVGDITYLIFAQASKGVIDLSKANQPSAGCIIKRSQRVKISTANLFHPYCDRDPTFCLIGDETKNGKMSDFRPFSGQKVSGDCW